MKRFAVPVSFVVAAVGLQLLATQPAEARGWKHHMRDQFSRQSAFNNYGGWQSSFRANPIRQQFYGNAAYPGHQNFGYGGYGGGYGQRGCR